MRQSGQQPRDGQSDTKPVVFHRGELWDGGMGRTFNSLAWRWLETDEMHESLMC